MGDAMLSLSYGLFVITANRDGRDNGCITNTVSQVTIEPNRIMVAINKSNLTHDMIMDTKKFTVSTISQLADFALFKHFGYQSGRDVDKFADYKDCKRSDNGTMIITRGTNAYISADVEQCVDLGSHTLFIARVTESATLSSAHSATYAFYQDHIKPPPEKVGTTSSGQTIWRCKICGYEYVGEELPDDFICPICKHPASDFEKVTS